MGLKSGSRDAGLDDSEGDVEQPEEQGINETVDDTTTEPLSIDTEETETESKDELDHKSESQRPTMDSLPYKLRRDKVNEGREQVPYFLREEVIDGEAELQDTLEELLDEKVYKSDYREAAMVVAQRNPELIAEVLREWGYDLR
ncbi:hypothetical protein C5B91_18090 [Haloferax sp. Atlit-10N]|uniref:hypothetical protein n=1 Tax=Haloferax TaxID=2251 RepID=UPI000E26C228|nr:MULTISPECIES: hypothetical protein [unclassified Haloferax]RDZ44458.1 hypothetical protein C5B87_09585 [Haloferax sp. Atlit-16N]RDZ56267.1 hypothetical protein C5B91_18090 [Haloferax sp. Atlit-10N]